MTEFGALRGDEDRGALGGLGLEKQRRVFRARWSAGEQQLGEAAIPQAFDIGSGAQREEENWSALSGDSAFSTSAASATGSPTLRTVATVSASRSPRRATARRAAVGRGVEPPIARKVARMRENIKLGLAAQRQKAGDQSRRRAVGRRKQFAGDGEPARIVDARQTFKELGQEFLAPRSIRPLIGKEIIDRDPQPEAAILRPRADRQRAKERQGSRSDVFGQDTRSLENNPAGPS